MLLLADRVSSGLSIDSFWSALGVALAAAAVGVVLSVLFGTNDDDVYSLRVVQRIARRSGERVVTDRPGIVFLEIDGLALPVLQRAMRDGHAPTLARWLEDGTHRLAEWEPDLSSQTGASQAGILLGSNDDIVAFRWVEKERKVLVACSSPEDCAELERRHDTGTGPARRRRREPRQPLLGRRRPHDPHRQPDGGGAQRQPRLPRLPRERLQRRADVRALRLGGDPGMGRRREAAAPGRPAARPPGRRLSVPARDDVRHRPRPDRVRRPHRHDEGEARGLRDLRELRRGRTSLRPRARRHARGAAEARPAVRAHRARPPLRRAAVRARRPLRPRPDAGGDVPAAQRLRARRARAAEPRARRRQRGGGRRRAGCDGRARRRRGDGAQGEGARRTTSRAATSSSSARATSASST